MTEKEEEEEKLEKEVIINIINGVPCIVLQPGIVVKKLPPPQVIPFHFGTVQEFKRRDAMPDIIKDLKELFKNNKWGFTRIDLPKEKEDEKDDN